MTDYALGLTAVNIDAVLQGVYDGSLIPAINKIKTSQFVVEGTTGDPLPSTTATSYLSGAEMAFGWVVTTDVVDAVIDANGNLNATSGVVEYTFDKADNATPNAASLFASVMRCTDAANSVYEQDYADGSNGISITETATTITMVIDFSSFAGGKVFGASEQLGRLQVESTESIAIKSKTLKRMWIDETVNRSAGVTYTNTKGYEIGVSVLTSTSTGLHSARIIVDGSELTRSVSDSASTVRDSAWIAVPDGSTYSVELTNTTVDTWKELY